MPFLCVNSHETENVRLDSILESYIKRMFGNDQLSKISSSITELQSMRDSLVMKLKDKPPSTVDLITSDVPSMSSQSEVFRIVNHSTMTPDQSDVTKEVQLSARAFNYLLANTSMFSRKQGPEMSISTLSAFASVMSAQAEECLYFKAERSSAAKNIRNPAFLASVAAKVYSAYESALSNASQSSVKHCVPSNWTDVLKQKKEHYAATSQMYQARECMEQSEYGEAITRFGVALELLKSKSTHKSLQVTIKDELAKANRFNDAGFFKRVLKKEELKTIDPKSVLTFAPINIPLPSKDADATSKDLFVDLLPLDVMNAQQEAKTVLASMVTVEKKRLTDATEMMNAVMVSFNLPAAIQSSEVKREVPESLLVSAAAFRQQGGVSMLRNNINSLPDCAKRNREIANVLRNTLNESDLSKEGPSYPQEGKTDDNWATKIAKILSYLDTAQAADSTVTERFKKDEGLFEILSKSEAEIVREVEASEQNATQSPSACGTSKTRDDLALCCSQIETFKVERKDLQDQLEMVKVPPDLTKMLLDKHNAGELASMDKSRVGDELNASLEGVRSCVSASLNSQQELLAKLETANTAHFGSNRNSHFGESGSLVTRLTAACEPLDTLTKDVDTGIKFYADLTQNCLKLQEKLDDQIAEAKKNQKPVVPPQPSVPTPTQQQQPQSEPVTPIPARPPPPSTLPAQPDPVQPGAPPMASPPGMPGYQPFPSGPVMPGYGWAAPAYPAYPMNPYQPQGPPQAPPPLHPGQAPPPAPFGYYPSYLPNMPTANFYPGYQYQPGGGAPAGQPPHNQQQPNH